MAEEIVRRVKLTPFAAQELSRDLRKRVLVSKVLSDMMMEALDRLADVEEDSWDEVARICGYDSHASAKLDGMTFRVSWARNEVDVLKNSSQDDGEDDCE